MTLPSSEGVHDVDVRNQAVDRPAGERRRDRKVAEVPDKHPAEPRDEAVLTDVQVQQPRLEREAARGGIRADAGAGADEVADAEGVEGGERARVEEDGAVERLDHVGFLECDGGAAGLGQRDGDGEPADAGAGDECGAIGHGRHATVAHARRRRLAG